MKTALFIAASLFTLASQAAIPQYTANGQMLTGIDGNYLFTFKTNSDPVQTVVASAGGNLGWGNLSGWIPTTLNNPYQKVSCTLSHVQMNKETYQEGDGAFIYNCQKGATSAAIQFSSLKARNCTVVFYK